MASRHRLPLLIIYPAGVQVRRQSYADGKGYVLEFGDIQTPKTGALPPREASSCELLSFRDCLNDENS